MVRHQDLEFDATSDHMKLTLERVKTLGKKGPSVSRANKSNGIEGDPHDDEERDVPKGMITYRQMRRCLLRLGYTWNRCTPPAVDNHHYDDDDISIISNFSSSTRHSHSGGVAVADGGGGFGNVRDIIATDAQLIMLLTTLVEMEERYHYSSRKQHGGDDEEDTTAAATTHKVILPQGLYIAEFIQAYKLIIGGMQSLQTYPTSSTKQDPSNNGSDDSLLMQELRTRSRERTLGLLRLFGPDASLYNNYSTSSNTDGDSSSSLQHQSAGESPAGKNQHKSRKSNDDGLTLTPNRSSSSKNKTLNNNDKDAPSKKEGTVVAVKDGLLPRLTDAEIRKMVHSKDIALAKILEEHESEMNVMAMNMEELRLQNVRTFATLKKRKKRARAVIVILTVVLVMGGGYLEYTRRKQIKREIAYGREIERKADEELIMKLGNEIEVLTLKLNDAEATIRYEESRYDSIKKTLVENERLLVDMETKWKIESGELERCRVTRKELDVQLSSVTVKNVDMEEEVGWCRERLVSTERALEGMERVLSKNDRSGGGGFSEIAKAAAAEMEQGEGGGAFGNDETNKNHKPVLMEMKYNKSFRNAVLLRQTYSVVAGMAASVLLQGLLPGLVNVIRMIFIR